MAVDLTNPEVRNLISMDGPAIYAEAVTPSDTADLPDGPAKLLVGTAGDLEVTLAGMTTGTSVVLTVPAGYQPLFVSRVWAAGTTAGSIFLLR